MRKPPFTPAPLGMSRATRDALERNAKLAADLARLMREARAARPPPKPPRPPKVRIIR